MNKILYMFLISMVPVVELRGSIPYAAAVGIPWHIALPLAIVGNLLPVPFILLFVKKESIRSSKRSWISARESSQRKQKRPEM